MRRDLACSLILLVVAIGYFAAASRIGTTALSDAVGAGGLPRIYGVALAVLAVALGITALARRRADATAVSRADSHTDGPSASRTLVRGAGAVTIGVAYLIVVSWIGYALAMALMLAAMAVYHGARASWRVLVVATVGAAVLFVLFDVVLGVTLPAPWRG